MEQNIQQILVTGANGFVGKQLTQALVSKGYKVHAIVRKRSWQDQDVNFIVADLRDLQQVKFPAQIDVVIHLAAGLNMYDNDGTLTQSNLGITRNLLKKIKDRNAHLIYFSSIEAAGPTSKLPVNEFDKPRPISDYGIAKLETENWLRSNYHNLTIFRAGSIITEKAGLIYDIQQKVRNSMFWKKLYSCFNNFEISYIYFDDLLKAVFKSIENPGQKQLYYLTNKSISVGEIINNKYTNKLIYSFAYIFAFILRLFRRGNLLTYVSLGGKHRSFRRYSKTKIEQDLKINFSKIWSQ